MTVNKNSLANLKKFDSNQSREQAVKNGRKGGIKSAENKQARKTLKEELELLLENKDTQKNVAVALLDKVLRGDTKAIELYLKILGEYPKESETTNQNNYVRTVFVTPEMEREVQEHIDRVINGD